MKNSRSIRNTLIYALLLVALAVFFVTSFTRNSDSRPRSISARLRERARSGEVKSITVNGNDLTVALTNGQKVRARKEDDGSLVETLREPGRAVGAFGSEPNQIQIISQAAKRLVEYRADPGVDPADRCCWPASSSSSCARRRAPATRPSPLARAGRACSRATSRR